MKPTGRLHNTCTPPQGQGLYVLKKTPGLTETRHLPAMFIHSYVKSL